MLTSKITKLEKGLADVSIKTLIVDGKAYTISNGKVVGVKDSKTRFKVLRLASFYQWNKEDPLFWAPGFDSELIRPMVLQDNKDHKAFLKLIGVDKSTFPYGFLSNMVNAASDEASFISHPSDKLAQKLLEDESKTADFYISDSKNLSDVFSDKLSLLTFAIQVKEEIFKSDAGRITDNGYALKKEIDARKACLEGKGNCIRPYLSFKKPSGTETSQQNYKILPKSLIYPNNSPYDIYGPYIANSLCYGWGNNFSLKPQAFYIRYVNGMADVQLATDVYFKKIYSETLDQDEIKLANRGIDHIWTSSTSPYRCPYHAPLAEIVTVDNFIKNYKPIFGDKAFTDLNNKSFFDEAKRAEDNFFASKYPSYDSLKILSDYYSYSYRLLANGENNKLRDELLNRYLLINRKLDGLNTIFSYISYYVKSPIEGSEVSNRNGSLNTLKILYKYRTYYGFFYFPFSPSFWRSSDGLDYANKVNVVGATGFDKLYLLYSEAINKYSASTIKSWASLRR